MLLHVANGIPQELRAHMLPSLPSSFFHGEENWVLKLFLEGLLHKTAILLDVVGMIMQDPSNRPGARPA